MVHPPSRTVFHPKDKMISGRKEQAKGPKPIDDDDHHHHSTDVIEVTLGASGRWLETWTGANGTDTRITIFLVVAHGSMD